MRLFQGGFLLKHTLPMVVALIFGATSHAATLSWGSASLSDNSGGSFLAGSTVATSGLSFVLSLPNFSQSNFAFFSGEVDVSVTATYDQPWINGVVFRYDGVIDQTNGPAEVDYFHTASASSASPGSGNFTVPPFAGTLGEDVSTNSVNITAQINLNDNGGLAAINSIEFDIVAPEPATAGAMVLGVALLGLFGHKRRSAR